MSLTERFQKLYLREAYNGEDVWQLCLRIAQERDQARDALAAREALLRECLETIEACFPVAMDKRFKPLLQRIEAALGERE